jgi:hypothetical protein
MNITVKDVPEELHGRLRQVADETGRSLNKLILVTLERAFVPQQANRSLVIERIRSRRERMHEILRDDMLQNAIQGDRS